MIRLYELAIASMIFSSITGYNSAYNVLLKKTGGEPDLSNDEHRLEILKWLNKWGCRQFKKDYHIHASNQLYEWHKENQDLLPDKDINIWELVDFDSIGKLFTSLSGRVASYKKRNETEIATSFGPTGTSKILFAIRSKSLIPCDIPMREKFQLSSDSGGYITYLKKVISSCRELEEQCKKNGFSLEDFPKIIKRPNTTIPKLIDEYHWITLTKNFKIPNSKIILEWLNFKL